MTTDIRLVTRDATLDTLSASEYRDMFDELRPIDPKTNKRLSLDKFIAAIGSQYSKAMWGRYDNGEPVLNRNMRSELRVAVGLPELPPTVLDAVSAATSPDAAVWTVGDGPAEHVILVSGGTPTTFHVNGKVTVSDTRKNAEVTEVTSARLKVYRPMVSIDVKERIERLEVPFMDVLMRGIESLEQERRND